MDEEIAWEQRPQDAVDAVRMLDVSAHQRAIDIERLPRWIPKRDALAIRLSINDCPHASRHLIKPTRIISK
jgi:hypothetical protein